MTETKQETKTATTHVLVPKHELLKEPEAREEVLQKYNISRKQMPSISIKDQAIKHLETKAGDIIKITRKSNVSGISLFYRVVIE